MSDTADRERLMALKKKMARKRPKFERPESWRYVRITKNWRKPKGIDNKTRQKRRGWPASLNVGYGSPKAVRDLHPSGMEEVAVFNVGDLAIIDPETQSSKSPPTHPSATGNPPQLPLRGCCPPAAWARCARRPRNCWST